MIHYRLILGVFVLAVSCAVLAQEAPTTPIEGVPAVPVLADSPPANTSAETPIDTAEIISDGKGQQAVPVEKTPAAIEKALANCDAIEVMIGTRNVARLLKGTETSKTSNLPQRIHAAIRRYDYVKLYVLNKKLLIQTPQRDRDRPELRSSAQIAQSVLDAVRGRDEGEDTATPDVAERMDFFRAMTGRTKSAPDDSAEFPRTLFLLRHTKAAVVARIVEQLYQQQIAAVVADEHINGIIVRCAPDRLKEIEQLLKVLDDEALPLAVDPNRAESEHTFSFFIGITRESSDELRKRYQNLEDQSRELAMRLRGATANPGAVRNSRQQLQDTVRQAFEARQKLHRAELAEFARRLQRIQQSIEARDKLAQQIVDRRVEALLDPDLEWESATPPGKITDSHVPPSAFAPTADIGFATTTEPQSSVPTENVLTHRPEELHELLTTRARQVEQLRETIRNWEAGRAEGIDAGIGANTIKQLQKQLEEYRRKQELAVQEYLQQVKLLEAVLQRDRGRLAAVEEDVRNAERLHEKGVIASHELRKTQLTLQEAQVAVQRAESLLKLYQQAGEGLVVPPSDANPFQDIPPTRGNNPFGPEPKGDSSDPF